MTELWRLVVIGDIRASRELDDRAEVQNRLDSALAHLNSALGPGELESDFQITLGDEFQGLLKNPTAAIEVIVSIDEWMRGIPIRYGLGWGPLGTDPRAESVGMDGPCYYLARDAVNESKEQERWVTARGFGTDGGKILNGLFSLIGAVHAGWTAKQAQTVALTRRAQTRKEVAEDLGVVPSVVSEALAAALFTPVLEAERGLVVALAVFGEDAESRGWEEGGGKP